MTVKQNEFLKEFYNLLLKYNAEINLQEDNWFEIDLKGQKPILIYRCAIDKSDIEEMIEK
jgi:hypothetical protein